MLAELMERLGAGAPEPGPGQAQSLARVLDGTETLLTAAGPRELDQAATTLIGAELYEILHGDAVGRHPDLWFTDLANAALERIDSLRTSAQLAAGGWQGPHFLLHAMTGLGSPAQGAHAASRAKAAAKLLGKAATGLPPWLHKLGKQSATGELWQLTDAYGGRHGVIAGFTYPGGKDASVYLFDIDTGQYADLASAGVYDNVEQAAAAWSETLGPDAADAQPRPVADPGTLYPLAYLAVGEEILRGDESRSVLDDYYRAQRRLHDVYAALARRRTPLPPTANRYQDIDIQPAVAAFTAWYTARHGAAPDTDAAEALATEWLEGATPGTEHLISPARVRHIHALIHDWLDDPVTTAVHALYPDWIRWHGEHQGLPPQLVENAVAVASAEPEQNPDDEPSGP